MSGRGRNGPRLALVTKAGVTMIKRMKRINFRLSAAQHEAYGSLIGRFRSVHNWTDLCIKGLEELYQSVAGPTGPLGHEPIDYTSQTATNEINAARKRQQGGRTAAGGKSTLTAPKSKPNTHYAPQFAGVRRAKKRLAKVQGNK
jgi:hypothetical protein